MIKFIVTAGALVAGLTTHGSASAQAAEPRRGAYIALDVGVASSAIPTSTTAMRAALSEEIRRVIHWKRT